MKDPDVITDEELLDVGIDPCLLDDEDDLDEMEEIRAEAILDQEGRAMSAPGGQGHVHLPSVHIRAENGTGFDYEQDLYISGSGRAQRIERVLRLVAIEHGAPALVRETFDVICADEWAEVSTVLPVLMEEGNPDATAVMEEVAHQEFDRQRRIAAGTEQACAACGCSETRACSGGCVWATRALCSRCV